MGSEMSPAIGVCVRNGWIRMDGRQPVLKKYPSHIPGEEVLNDLYNGIKIRAENLAVSYFNGRPGYIEKVRIEPSYSLTEAGKRTKKQDGVGMVAPSAAEQNTMDLETPSADAYIARTHPLYDAISEVREAFISLGFDEVIGGMVQSSFWNFDALFTPQDPPRKGDAGHVLCGRCSHGHRIAGRYHRGCRPRPQGMLGRRLGHGPGGRAGSCAPTTLALRYGTWPRTIRPTPEYSRWAGCSATKSLSYKHLAEFNQGPKAS